MLEYTGFRQLKAAQRPVTQAGKEQSQAFKTQDVFQRLLWQGKGKLLESSRIVL